MPRVVRAMVGEQLHVRENGRASSFVILISLFHPPDIT
jgi:hypothetical protein